MANNSCSRRAAFRPTASTRERRSSGADTRGSSPRIESSAYLGGRTRSWLKVKRGNVSGGQMRHRYGSTLPVPGGNG